MVIEVPVRIKKVGQERAGWRESENLCRNQKEDDWNNRRAFY